MPIYILLPLAEVFGFIDINKLDVRDNSDSQMKRDEQNKPSISLEDKYSPVFQKQITNSSPNWNFSPFIKAPQNYARANFENDSIIEPSNSYQARTFGYLSKERSCDESDQPTFANRRLLEHEPFANNEDSLSMLWNDEGSKSHTLSKVNQMNSAYVVISS